jgi:long-chain acyl-CoA synthetase
MLNFFNQEVVMDKEIDKTAFIWNEETFSYSQFDSYVKALSEQLSPIGEGEIIGIYLPNSPELLLTYFACFQNNQIPMPINIDLTIDDVVMLLDQAKCNKLVVSESPKQIKCFEKTNKLSAIYTIVGKNIKSVLLKTSSVRLPLPPVDTALILHTSGTSALPKAVLISKQALEKIIEGRIASAFINTGSVAIIASSLSHSVGLYQALAYLKMGAKFILLPDYNMDTLAQKVNEYLPTHLIMVVEAFDKLLQHLSINSDSFQNIQFAAVGADKVTPQVQQRFIQLTKQPLSTSYGMTELSWMLVNHTKKEYNCQALGKPTMDVCIKLLNELGAEVKTGETGEIVAKSPKQMTGYWQTDNGNTLSNDNWIYSGDLAYKDESGDYWFMGRKKDVIILSSGDNISPLELEQKILAIDGIQECIVVGIPKNLNSQNIALEPETPQAFIVCNKSIQKETIILHLEKNMSKYKLPTDIHFLAEIPRGASRKISRATLRNWLIEQSCGIDQA